MLREGDRPMPSEPVDETARFLSGTTHEFAEYLSKLKSNERVFIKIPLSKAPHFMDVKQWLLAFDDHL